MEKMQNITFITIFFYKFYLNQTSITMKNVKNLINRRQLNFQNLERFKIY